MRTMIVIGVNKMTYKVFKLDEVGNTWLVQTFQSRMLAENYIRLVEMKTGKIESDKMYITEEE